MKKILAVLMLSVMATSAMAEGGGDKVFDRLHGHVKCVQQGASMDK